MGYDMFVCDEHGAMIPEGTLSGVDWSDQAAAEAASKRQNESHCYLRRSIGGQGPLRERLEEAGMAFVAAGREVSYGGGGWPEDLVRQPEGEPDAEYEKRLTEFLRKQFDERPGIPLHKLCGNDGWWVTAVECRTALVLWEKSGSPEISPWVADDGFDDVIEFLRQGAAHGGFRVY